MNPIIKEQLEKCKHLNISSYDDTTTFITISKSSEYILTSLKEGHIYIVELAGYLLTPPQDSSLHANWNNNIIPTEKIMKIAVVKCMGTMVNFNGYGVDKDTEVVNNNYWQGWVPVSSLRIIKEI